MSRALLAVVSMVTTLACCAAASASSTLTIGIVTDGAMTRSVMSPAFILSEARSVLGSELVLEIPEDKRFNGGWTRDGIRSALDALLDDPDVDVLTLGLLSSYEAAHRPVLTKPVIAPFVVGPVLQGYPLQDGRSGRHNFVYVASFRSVADELRLFQRVVRHVAALVDRLSLESMPELDVKAQRLAAELGVRVTLVPVTTSVDEALAAMPADTDAVGRFT